MPHPLHMPFAATAQYCQTAFAPGALPPGSYYPTYCAGCSYDVTSCLLSCTTCQYPNPCGAGGACTLGYPGSSLDYSTCTPGTGVTLAVSPASGFYVLACAVPASPPPSPPSECVKYTLRFV